MVCELTYRMRSLIASTSVRTSDSEVAAAIRSSASSRSRRISIDGGEYDTFSSLQLLAHPPQLVAGTVEVGQRFAVTRQIVELAAVTSLTDLLVDPRFPGHTGRLSCRHRTARTTGEGVHPAKKSQSGHWVTGSGS